MRRAKIVPDSEDILVSGRCSKKNNSLFVQRSLHGHSPFPLQRSCDAPVHGRYFKIAGCNRCRLCKWGLRSYTFGVSFFFPVNLKMVGVAWDFLFKPTPKRVPTKKNKHVSYWQSDCHGLFPLVEFNSCVSHIRGLVVNPS